MSNTRKDYEKAERLYHNGQLEKSLKHCELGISKNLKNPQLLNLKGLLLYLKGDLKEAITVWKINKDYNNDNMAKSYIKDAEDDYERLNLYNEAQELIKALKIDNAIEILTLCTKSDFNSIKVNNAFAICYLRKGQYDQAKIYINKVLVIDKENNTAKSIIKEIDSFSESGSKKNIILSIVIILIICISGGAFIINKAINYKAKANDVSPNTVIENNINKEEASKETENHDNKSIVTSEKKNLEIKEKSLTLEEVKQNYIQATTYFKEEKYVEASNLLEKSLPYSKESYLNDDILFLIASTKDKLKDVNASIKYFEEYISLYENGNYIEESYYKLALAYKDINIIKSKEYAQILINKYPKSIYNNSNIDAILKI
ncbi:hypothetical protein JCM1393_14780 [Clostridium carnis]